MPSVLVNSPTTGDTVIAAPANGFIRLLGFILTADGATDIMLTADDDPFFPIFVGATGGGGAVVQPLPDWQFDLPVGAALKITFSGGVGIGGRVTYSFQGTTINNPPRS